MSGKLNPAKMSDEELLAQVIIFGATIVRAVDVACEATGKPILVGYYWDVDNRDCDAPVMAGYYETRREACIDFLVYKGILNGKTNGEYNAA